MKGEWTCTRCTFAGNHPIDRICVQCRTPRFIKYPAIPALDIPQVNNPYSEREFTSTQGLPPNANLPTRRHAVPPSRTSDADSDSDTDLYVGENPYVDKSLDFHTPVTGSPDVSHHEMDTNSLGDTGRRNSPNVSNQSFYALNAAVATPPTSEPTPPSSLPRKFVSIDDFLDQSMTGFKKSDFKKPWKTQQPLKDTNYKLDFSFKNQTKPVVTGQNQTKPADTEPSDFMNLTPIGYPAVNPLEPVETGENQTEPMTDPGSSDFMNLTPIDSPAANPLESAETDPLQTELVDPGPSDFMNLSPIVSPKANPLEPAETGQIQDVIQDRSHHDALKNFLPLTPPGMPFSPKSSTMTSQPKIVQPENLNPLTPSALIADPPSNSDPAHEMFTKEDKTEDPVPLKKIKPTKSGNPILILGRKIENERKTNSEIMSLFEHDVFGTPPNEPPPEISSLRSASIKTPPGGASNLDIFDPFAPKRDSELEYIEDHFGKKTQVTQETRTPAVPSEPITTSVPIGGARRKTTRPTGLPVIAATTENRPSTSTTGEKMSSSVDPTKWSCPLCTYSNRISAQYCEICHDGRPPWYDGTRHSPILIDPPTISSNPQPNEESVNRQTTGKAFLDGWTCQFCAVTNNPSYPLCQSCGKTRPDGFASLPEPLTWPGDAPMSPTSPGTSMNPFGIMRQSSFAEDVGSLTASPMNSTTISNQGSIRMTKVKEDMDKSSLTVFQNIKEYCSQTKEKFIDDQFIPSINILQYPGERNPVIENAIWLRPHELKTDGNFFGTRRWTVFSEEGPRSADIRQGILGNCWFLSALSVLCERTELLYKIFVTDEYNEHGAYMIRLCKDGVWQTLIIDDLLPCSSDGKLIYSQAVRRQLWVPLIEKALAKVHGCYEALQAGRTIEGLATLTGAPCESLQLVTGADRTKPEPDLIWARLLSSKEAGFLMGASCGGATMDVDSTIYDRVNLRVRHAYSVLDVRTERTDEGNHVKLLQLRNPWAQQSWSGMWSDRDQIWDRNPRLKNRLKPNLSHDGIFWINFQDMMFYFDSVDICKVQTGRDLYEVRTQGVFPDSAKVPPTTFFLEVNTSTEIDLSIFQQGSRSVEGSGRHPVDICVCVYRSNETAAASAPGSEVSLGSLVVASRRQVKRHSSCWHWFETGYYQIVTLAFNHWVSAFGGGGAASSSTRIGTEPPKYVLALHSTKEVSISYFRPNTNILADAVFELAVKRGDFKDLRDCATCYYLAHGWAGLIIVAENRHPAQCLQIICDCEESINVVSTRGRLKTIDCVPPLHKQVLVVLTQLDGHSGFTITHKEVHKMAGWGLGDWSVERDHDPPLNSEVSPLHKPRPL